MVTWGVTNSYCHLSRLTLQRAMEKHPLITYSALRGRSLAKIAKDAGCSRMTLYRLIKGEQNATIDLLNRVSAATGGEVPPSVFLAPQPETAA